ncbi:hypothetical protein BHE90_011844 [Fusarium euwallaceae]|uniref:Uncharacterized protein n=1 Tax=Fusarium euwallaceae TaxID=1147111 RepID=A0A430LDB2_9HYPO|nr:hypothetical protein BHE90_011844 [Fusarium euwallaceae]
MTEATITVRATHTVVNANPERLESLDVPYWLGPLDHTVYPSVPINVIWIYQTSPEFSELVPISRLRNALSILLDSYPTLTGRLSIEPDSGRRYLDRFGTGMSLLEATCGNALTAFSRSTDGKFDIFDFPSAGDSLLGPWEGSVESAQRDPLLTVQHTRFACGSVTVGLRIAHMMCDAGGFLQLYQDLAHLYRGLGSEVGTTPKLDIPPAIEPFLSDKIAVMSDEEREAAVKTQPQGFSLAPAVKLAVAAADKVKAAPSIQGTPPPPPIKGRSMRFSATELSAIKKLATSPSENSWVSTFSALSAHIFQRVHKARLAHLEAEKLPASSLATPSFLTSINYSSKLGFPPKYFPNAVITPFTEIPSSELAEEPLWRVAEVIHGTIHSTTPDQTRELCFWIAAQPYKNRICHEFPISNASFITSAWHKYPLYSGAELDVAPVFVSPSFTLSTLVDGLAYFLQPKESNGDINIVMSLSEPVWDHLDRDMGFRHLELSSQTLAAVETLGIL